MGPCTGRRSGLGVEPQGRGWLGHGAREWSADPSLELGQEPSAGTEVRCVDRVDPGRLGMVFSVARIGDW